MHRAFGLGAILFVFWLSLSGHYTPFLVTLGALSSALVVWISGRMALVDEEGVPTQITFRLIRYAPWLMKEILVANLRVARIILSPSLPISPVIVHYRATQSTDLGRVIYANSITLTPGTITTRVSGADLEIHSLSWMDVDGREEDEMGRRVRWVEQGSADPAPEDVA